MNGILTYRCRDVLFSPKKLGLQDKDVNRNLGLSLLWQGSFQLSPEVSTSNCPPSISRGRVALELRFGAELRLTCQGKNGSQGTEKAFARTKLLDKTELCGENRIWNETVRRLTSLLLAPLLQRRPGVLAESLTSHWDASSCKRLSSTYICFTGTKKNPFTTQSYLDILQPLAKYEARMGDLIGNNDGSTNSLCRLQTSGNSSFTGFHGFKLVFSRINPKR